MHRRTTIAVFAAAFALLAAFAWARDVWDPDEGRYASVALDMARSGDFVTPRLAGMRFVDKPPLLYWLANGAYALLGPTPLAARLPCLAAGAAFCALLSVLATQWGLSRRAAWLAALAAATSFGGMALSRTVTTDMVLAACVLGAVVAGGAAIASDRIGPRLALGVAVGLGLLAKGPIAAAVPAVVAFAWIVAGVRAGRVLRVLVSPTAWAVALAIAVPWYAAMERANPGYLRHFLVHEHLRRFTEAGYREAHPVWLYLAIAPLALVPWTPWCLRARLPGHVDAGRRGPVCAGRLAWAWVAGGLLFFSAASTRLVTYVLPILPPLYVIVGARLSEVVEEGGTPMRRLAWTLFGAGAALAIGGGAVALGALRGLGVFADERWSALGVPLAIAAAAPLSTPFALRLARSPRARAAALMLPVAAGWWGIDLAASRVDDLRSARALAAVLERAAGRGDAIVVLDRYPQGLRFHADVDVVIAENPRPASGRRHTQREIVEPWATLDGTAAGRLISMADLKALWAGPRRVVLTARDVDVRAEFPDGRRLAQRLQGAQRTDLVVVENRPR